MGPVQLKFIWYEPHLGLTNFTIPAGFRPPDKLLISQAVVKTLLVRDVFLFDVESQALRLRQSSAQFVRHPIVSKRIVSLVSTHQLLRKSYLGNCCDTSPIPLSARTVYYRDLHRKIPTKFILNLRIPQQHPTPTCSICSSLAGEDFNHFLFTCPPKFQV
ncbi:hypothetical protein HPULCUR_005115 [Helicostylum pulchrum]|uniref:Reverse transcriptase zinc-binding domain-containing protein n=1 Tax=Helicostylum pulchrum TaxID=562976 RepID=A0ABP9XZ23_9FUNG